jgi:hypothetical protein
MSGEFSRRDFLWGAAIGAAAAGLGVNRGRAAEAGPPDSLEAQTLDFIRRCAREDGGYAPEAVSMLQRVKDSPVLGGRWMWPFPPHNIYALYKYSEAGLLDNPAKVLPSARAKLELPPRIPEQLLLEHVWQLNMYIAGYEGYLGLQKLAGEPPDAQVQAQRDRLRQLWVEKVEIKSPWCDASGQRSPQYHKQRINIARCFIWMTPELGEYLRENAREKIEKGVTHLNDVAPYWFNAAFEGTMGEGNLEPLYDVHALFQAKALILREPQDRLDKYLDVPMFARGDLFYILNLVASIEAQ